MNSPRPVPVVIGLGANLGEPLVQLRSAIASLAHLVVMHAISDVYRSSPVGGIEQPDFYNLVCTGETRLDAEGLLTELLRIERAAGRERVQRFGPRTLDLDLICYAGEVREGSALQLPHPRMHLRRFVLEPLAEIAPGWRHPLSGQTAAALLASLPVGDRVERLGPLHEPGPAAR